jgi:hypothetical protein
MNGKSIMRFKNVYILIYADVSVQWHNLPIELIRTHEQMHIDFKEYCESKGIKSIPMYPVNHGCF